MIADQTSDVTVGRLRRVRGYRRFLMIRAAAYDTFSLPCADASDEIVLHGLWLRLQNEPAVVLAVADRTHTIGCDTSQEYVAVGLERTEDHFTGVYTSRDRTFLIIIGNCAWRTVRNKCLRPNSAR